ncbi:uncharacterized protein LOC136078272 [Hydra vulgaris]|uniref:Uncharacterized protein LOC136078272 n=1 Tax=Hydra vulgaris TaxID=6087 RepID=A0ABM4BL40_HYDVU
MSGKSKKKVNFLVGESRSGGFQILQLQTISKKIEKLILTWKLLKKNKSRQTLSEIEKRRKFLTQMKRIFWIAPELDTLVAIIKADKKRSCQDKTEDIAFLLDQLGDRKTRIGGLDTRYISSVNRSLSKFEMRSSLNETMSESEFSSNGSDKNEDNDDFPYPDPELKKKVKKPDTVLLPKDILKRTADTAVGEGLSHRQHTAMVNSIIAKAGGNLDEFKCSTSTALRAADKVINDESKRIKDHLRNFRNNNKNILVQLHFDGKVCHEYTDGKKSEKDRLAILINGNMETHLLGIPAISSGTGENQKNAIRDILNCFDLTNSIQAVTFDTTRINTGNKNGADSLLVNEVFQRPVLSIACRHHINELHITHFWKNYPSSATSGPDNMLFKILKSTWNDLDVENQVLRRLTIPDETWLGHQKHESITFCRNIITHRSLKKDGATRKDYIELTELTLMVLSEEKYKFRTPGTIHHARFMAKGIYYLKLQLMMDAIPSLTNRLKNEITEVATFVAVFYTTWFLKAELSAVAPCQDMRALRQMNRFKEYNLIGAESVIESIKRHTWFLDPCLVVLALADENCEERGEIAQKLYSFEFRSLDKYSLARIKANMEVLNSLDFSGPKPPSLVELVTENSWLLFLMIGQSKSDCQWMKTPPEYWTCNDFYLKFKDAIFNLAVVNDCSERTVKLIKDNIDIARKEEKRQDSLLFMHNYKRKYVGKRKTSKKNKKTI